MNSLASMLDEARHWRVRYRSRQLIYDEGDAPTGIFRVEAGCVRLQVTGADGNRQIIAFLFPGDVFGVCTAERASAAEAVCDAELTLYSLPAILQLSTRSTDLVVQLVQYLSDQFSELAHHMELVAHLPSADRVLWFLTWLAGRQGHPRGETVRLPMTLRDVGDFLALSPETLSRVLRELQSGGLLALRGRRAFSLPPIVGEARSFAPVRRGDGHADVLGGPQYRDAGATGSRAAKKNIKNLDGDQVGIARKA